MRRIGVLMGYAESGSSGQALIAAFREGLQKLGWTEGRNTRIDIRWATPADAESIRGFAKELVALQPDLIISSTTPITAALLQQTRTIPIIFPALSDPVGSGFVASFSRPGSNVTGFNVVAHREELISLAARYRLPAVYAFRFFTELGGLLTTYDDLDPPCTGFKWSIIKLGCLRLPFVSYVSASFLAYAGWQPNGFFGVKLNLKNADFQVV
jgi:ABC transporter substrate binding protein